MEPRIQYATTSDGVSIAFWTLGNGPPLVEMQQTVFSHLLLELEGLPRRAWYERIAQTHTLVRFDPRGFGLSDRVETDFSLDAFVWDVEAVVDRLGLNEFDLFGLLDSGPVAVAYAVAHPERVSHLILWQSWARYVEWRRTLLPFLHLAESDWDLFVDTYAARLYGLVDANAARNVADVMRANLTPDLWRAINAAIEALDVSLLLPSVAAPTLILYREAAGSKEMTEATRFLGARLPNAEIAFLPGDLPLPWRGDPTEVGAAADTIEAFLGQVPRSSPSGTKQRVQEAKDPLPSGTAIILFADIADSTGLTERLGDSAFRGKARELDEALRAAIRECGGTPVEGRLVGDGLMAVFTSAHEAIAAALRCGRAGESVGLQLHLGVHAGDVIREEGNVYGGAVNIAARISALSGPGEVLVSDTVRGLARTSAGVTFEDSGEHELKGVAEPQRLFAVRAQSAGS